MLRRRVQCNRPAARDRGLLGRVLRSLVGALVAVLILRTWLIEGLFLPLVVSSGSMAPGLLGVHRRLECADCGWIFACGTDLPVEYARVACPNCGYADNDLKSATDTAGDRLLIDKAAFSFRPPNRWEVVALRDPEHAARILVKRIVGLPGEAVEVRHGDVYADGQIQRKTLAQLRAMAVAVHDVRFSPTRDPVPKPRWSSEKPTSRWRGSDGRMVHPGGQPAVAGDEPPPMDWLVYRHWHRKAGDSGEVCHGPIDDRTGYNQAQSRHYDEINSVTDVLLSFRLTATGDRGGVAVRATDGRNRLSVRLALDSDRWLAWHNGRQIANGTFAREELESAGGVQVEVALVDCRFLMALDGRTRFAFTLDPPQQRPRAVEEPVAIGSEGAAVEIRDVRLYRDVYYTQIRGIDRSGGDGGAVQLGDNAFFVLGDNSPISRDSRRWPQGGGVSGELLIGRPIRAFSVTTQ